MSDCQEKPSSYEIRALGEIAEVRLGKTPRKTNYRSDGQLKIIKFRDILEAGEIDWGNDDKGFVADTPESLVGLRELQAGDVLVTASAHMSEHIGKKAALVKSIPIHFKDAFVVGEILQIRPKPGVDPRWILNYLRSRDGYKAIQKKVQGVHLIASRAREIELPVADIGAQRHLLEKIDKQFSCLDEAVAGLQRVKANLKHYKAAVLKAAVEGRLVPTEAELASREGRSYETGTQLLQRILEIRRIHWQGKGKYKEPAAPDTTDSPELPEGWAWSNVDQLAKIGTGATPQRDRSEYYQNGHIPWVTSAVVNQSHVDVATEFVTAAALEKTNLTLYPAGTLLIAMYGEGKTRGMCTELRIAAATNQALAALQANADVRDYLRLFLEHNYVETRKAASGGVQPNLNLNLVRSIRLPLPPLAEQHRIIAEVDRLLSIAREVETEVDANLKRAQGLRQVVLTKSFTYQV